MWPVFKIIWVSISMGNQLHEVGVQKSTSQGLKLVRPWFHRSYLKYIWPKILSYDSQNNKNTGGSVLTIFGRSDFLGIFLKEMDFSNFWGHKSKIKRTHSLLENTWLYFCQGFLSYQSLKMYRMLLTTLYVLFKSIVKFLRIFLLMQIMNYFKMCKSR